MPPIETVLKNAMLSKDHGGLRMLVDALLERDVPFHTPVLEFQSLNAARVQRNLGTFLASQYFFHNVTLF